MIFFKHFTSIFTNKKQAIRAHTETVSDNSRDDRVSTRLHV